MEQFKKARNLILHSRKKICSYYFKKYVKLYLIKEIGWEMLIFLKEEEVLKLVLF